MQYRLSRRTTIGVDYIYQRFEFTRVLGTTDAHAVNGTFGMQLSRFTEFSGYFGVMRAETKFIQTIPVAPAIAALLGITESRQVVHAVAWQPNFSGRLSRTFQTGVAYVAGGQSISPGNGLFLTSRMTMLLGGYSYTGLRRWSFGASVLYTRGSSVGNYEGVYSSTSGTVTASRRLFGAIHFISSASARQYDSPDFTRYNRVIYTARVGLGWSPGDIPLRIW
jgi:hypothetical protein